jgi:serine/threonine protein kinase/Flp pilus assembly protein TadD
MSQLSAGKRLIHYEILSLLGVGGMGEVYLARDTKLSRKVALKVLPKELTANHSRVKRFTKEARAASALSHPNVAHIYQVDEQDGLHFIAMEYVEGQTLRSRIKDQPLTLDETLDIAIQVASALQAAHNAGIVHRDIKPENLMLRPDGYVKVLDFGLAKLTEKPSQDSDSEASTLSNGDTDPGIVMGTLRYMSPEQARGKAVDGRTDIFSLGVTLYEMTTGRPPFAGDSVADVVAALLEKEPVQITGGVSETPQELHRIIYKTLRKTKEERYQTMAELLLDLKNLRDALHVQSRLEHAVQPPAMRKAIHQKTSTLIAEAAQTAMIEGRPQMTTRSSFRIDYLVWQLSRYKRGLILLTGLLLAAVLALLLIPRKPVLTEQDTILLADFVNTTEEPIFDGTLKQGLAVQLQQSPFLNLFPDVRVRQTLRLMGRSQEERVNAEIGREICQRQGLKAVIVGTIARLGNQYVITLETVNGRTGELVASEQTQANSQEEILKALGKAASRLREKLGESLSSIEKFDKPLEATTSSLEALQAFSRGVEYTQTGNFLEAIPLYKRAVTLDPDFAYAYGSLAVNYNNTRQPKLAAENADKAFQLQARMSELEKLRITSFYYAFVTGEVEKGIEALEIYRATYPRDERGPLNLSDRYGMLGQFERSVSEARAALALNPNNAIGYWNLADSLTRLNRFEEARETCEHAIQQNLETTALHTFLYQIAFVNGDREVMQHQLNWASDRRDAYVALDWQAAAAAFAGLWRQSQDFSSRAIELATRSDAREVAARYAAEAALRAAVFGRGKQAKATAELALALEANRVSLARSALALALCGESAQAQAHAEELARRYPKDTLINGLWLPTIQALLEVQRHNPAQAIRVLEPVRRFEAAAEFWPQYARGLAYLRASDGAQAAAEFQKILDHRGEAALSTLYSLAHLGQARAFVLQGDKLKARRQYEDFMALWKDADTDLPVGIEARAEYNRLK